MPSRNKFGAQSVGRAFFTVNGPITPPYILRCTGTWQLIYGELPTPCLSAAFAASRRGQASLLRFGFHFTAEIRKTTSVPGREQIVHPPTLCRTNARCLQTVGKNFRHKLSASITVFAAKTAVFFAPFMGGAFAFSLIEIPPYCMKMIALSM